MSAAITFTDSGDGTGGVVTVAGSAVGSSNAILAMQQLASGGAWSTVGTRTGDGTVAVSLTPGGWWLQLQTTSGGISSVAPIIAANPTNGTAVHNRCWTSVLARCQTVALSGPGVPQPIPPTRMYQQIHPNDKTVQFPCVLCTIDGTVDEMRAFDTAHDEVGYGVRVLVVDREDLDYVPPMATYLGWRRQLAKAFRFTGALAGASEVYRVTLEPDTVVDPNLPRYMYFTTGFVVRCWAIESRP